MGKIIKNFEISPGVSIKAVIDDGMAILLCNYERELYKIYIKAKEDGKDVQWHYRKHAMIEKFSIPKEDYEKNLDIDYQTALKAKKESEEETKQAAIKAKNEPSKP